MSDYGHDEPFDDLLTDFLEESDQLLDSINPKMRDLEAWVYALEEGERARCDDQLVNDLFRATHSFKGLAATVGLSDIYRLTHSVENVFEAARSDQLQLSSRSVDVISRSLDRLEGMVACLKDESLPAVDCDEPIAAIAVVLEEAGANQQQAFQEDADSALVDEPSVEPWEEQDLFGHIVDESDVPPKYLSIFIDEADLSLDELSEILEKLSYPPDAGDLQSLLVTAHRLKGSAASIGLHRPAKLSHLMEDVLQDARDRGGPVDPAIVSAMLRCVDTLREYIEGFTKDGADSNGFNTSANALMEACHFASSPSGESQGDTSSPLQFASAQTATGDAGDTASEVARTLVGSEDAIAEPAAAAEITPEFRDQVLANQPSGARGVLGCVRMQPNVGLAGMKAQLLLEKLRQVSQIVACKPPEASLADAETLEGFEFAVTGDVDEGAIRLLLAVGGIESVDVASWAVAAEQEVAKPFAEAAPSTPPPPPSKPASKPSPILEKPTQAMVARPPKTVPEQKVANPAARARGKENTRPAETLRVEIDRLDQLMNLAGQLVINKARFTQLGDRLKQQVSGKRAIQLTKNAQGMVRRVVSGLDSAESADRSETILDDVRGHVRHLEQNLEKIAQEIAVWNSVRASVTELVETIDELDRVTDGIQKSVMDTRMVPVGPLFNRFKRVIRDITRGNGKAIDLVLRGEKTELDKRMIDELGDPLIHMVRNSVDHGIESPKEREAAGKPPRGTVTLNAFHRGNRIVIEVTDDGRGIDAAKVRQKAIEREIISPADAERMSNHQLFQLIWNAGFSTAEKVTDVSGRGMGMDIVRAKIEELNGYVELDSEPDVGTVFSIQLPLTLAIMPSLMAQIDGDIFALPLETVVEIVSVSRSDFTTIQGALTARVRGRVLSVADLAETFSWNRQGPAERHTQRKKNDDVTLVIAADQSQELGLIVDDLLGEESIVIKSMSENYRNVEGIAGASILGDGRVALILDVAAVIQMAKRTVTLSRTG